MIKSLYLKGIIAELYVLGFLILKGYRPIKWRMRNKISEIDLIMTKNNMLIALEVKYRKNNHDGLYAVTYQQQHNIRQAFMLFNSSYNQNNKYHTLRCDVCIVSRYGIIQHLQNAF
jgi:putative endonuclease